MALLVRLGVLTVDEASKLNDHQVSILVESVSYELVQNALTDAKLQAHLKSTVGAHVASLAKSLSP